MTDSVAIAREMGKRSLVAVAEELGVPLEDKQRASEIVDILEQDLADNGIPDGDVSDELFNLMVHLGFIDDQGNILEEQDEPEQEDDPQDDPPVNLPQCYGWGDAEHDPACERCASAKACTHQREQNVRDLVCYGVQYDSEAPECQECVMWRLCQEAKSQ